MRVFILFGSVIIAIWRGLTSLYLVGSWMIILSRICSLSIISSWRCFILSLIVTSLCVLMRFIMPVDCLNEFSIRLLFVLLCFDYGRLEPLMYWCLELAIDSIFQVLLQFALKYHWYSFRFCQVLQFTILILECTFYLSWSNELRN